MALFTEAEQKAIARAVEEVELTTSGELVVVHTARSADYAQHRAAFALFFGLVIVDLVYLVAPWFDVSVALLAVAVVAVGSYVLAGYGPMLRLLVPAATRAERCMERALRAMIEQGVTETRDRSGVLIFLSEAEHRVVILADHGINQRVDGDEWDRDVATLVAALKAGTPADGVQKVIGRIGSLLSASFPPRKDDTNELSNAPREV